MLPAPSTANSRARPPLSNLIVKAKDSLGQAIGGSRQHSYEKIHDQSYPRSSASPHSAHTGARSSTVSQLRAMLPSPKTTAFIFSCLAWYMASALSSNTSKALLSSPKVKSPMEVRKLPPFPYPVTLTLIQFIFIHLLSSAVASPTIMRYVPGMRKPVTRIVHNPGWQRIADMAKLSVFNVVGHAFSTVAISRVPVSTVHTIKALTPLFTVLCFRFIFKVQYSFMAYFSLVPLTLGVMMACTSLSFSANDLVGLSTALASTFIFVAQSIYSKNLVGRGSEEKKRESATPSTTASKDNTAKLDKINILYFTSACSIVIMVPMSLYYDGSKLFFGSSISDSTAVAAPHATLSYITYMITANGVVQFAQNFLAFSVLSLVSPVTYSIASLFKRVFVICFAIIWFGQSVGKLQWCGIVLTFVGLYIYNDAKSSKSIAKGEEMLERQERRKSMSLPTTARGAAWLNGTVSNHEASSPTASSATVKQTGYSARQGALYSGAGHASASAHASSYGHAPTTTANGVAPITFPVDPRRSIPSPPPSRGPSSDDEGAGKR